MNKYFIRWNIGYGDSIDVIEAKDQDEANEVVYDLWRDESENNADYSAEPLTKDLAEENGFDWDEDE